MREWSGPEFTGAKIALLCGDDVLVYKRDDKPDIPFPGLWDFPGGGRENGESPLDCALREALEEFGIAVDPACLIWEVQYPSWIEDGRAAYFFVATMAREDIEKIRFGDEGQYWEMMPIEIFLRHPEGVPYLQTCLREALLAIRNRLQLPERSQAPR